MVVNTWDGAVSTDWSNAGNWNSTGTTDRVPTTNDDVVIPDTSSLNNPTLTASDNPVQSLDISHADATLVGGGNKISVSGASSGVAVNHDGIISGVLDLEINSAAAVNLDLVGVSGNVRNLIINHANCVASLLHNTTISGDLTITLGELACQTGGSGRGMIVAGTTTVGPDSGGASQATLTVVDEDVSWGSGKTDGKGLHIRQGGVYVGGTAITTAGSLVIDNNAAAHFTNTTATATVNGHSNDSTRSILVGAQCTAPAGGKGTVDLTYGTASNIDIQNAAAILNLTLTGNVTYTCHALVTISGTLTITSGTTLTTGANKALTVTGGVTGAGTLTTNASAISFGYLTMTGTYNATTHADGTKLTSRSGPGAQLIMNVGDIVHNNGLFVFNGAAGGLSYCALNGASDGTNGLYNVEIDASGRTVTLASYALTIHNNLTVTAGTFTTSASDYALTVTGHVSVTGTLTGNASAISMGSLKIASGGTYSATSGTTFLLSELASSGFAFDSHSSGTFTHNNGTISIGNGTTAAETHLLENTFYNLIINLNSDTKVCVFRPKSGSTVTVANDLTMTRGVLYRNNVGDTFTVTNDVSVTSGSTLGRTNDTGASNFGSLTIASGGTYVATSGTTTLTSETSGGYTWRNDGGTFTHNSGTVTTSSSVDTKIKENTFYNIILNQSSSGKFVYWEDTSGNTCTVANDLTITMGRLRGLVASDTVTVTGDVSVAADGTFNHSSVWTGAVNHATLTVDSGGVYNATSGTTTISAASGAPSNGRAFYVANAAGAFVSSKGLISFTASSPQVAMVSAGGSATNNYFYDVLQNNGTMQWKGEHTHIENNLTMRGCQFNGGTGNIKVDGICKLTAGTFNGSDTSTRDSHLGTLVVESGAFVGLKNINISVDSIRNFGTVLGMGDITVTGNGGIIEGNLGAANVNVNLDPVFGNFNGTTSSLSSALADHDDIFAGNGGCFAAWVYPKGIGEGSYGRIFVKGGTYCWISGLSSGFATLKLSADFNTTDGEWNSTSAVIPMDSWSHVAIVYDSDAVSNDPVMYVNGVSVGVAEDTTPVGTYSDASSTLYIGNNDGGGGGSRTWDGYIMDVKIYKNVAVTATNVVKMASKINVDKDAPDMPTSGLQGWYPLTADDDDDSGEGNNLTAENMGSVVYDAFSVDVQDNTTTMGHVEVAQGVLNPKGLTSVNLDGTGDHIVLANNNIETKLRTSHTFSGWFKAVDGIDATNQLLIGQNSSDGGDRILIYIGGNGRLTWLYNAAGVNEYLETGYVNMENGQTPWHHFVASMKYIATDEAEMKLYLDGVQITTFEGANIGAYAGNMANYDSTHPLMFGAENNGGGDRYNFEGNLRDFRFYDYDLSSDQAASLYSGSYNVTPYHWYKMDDGSTTTASDTGTATAVDATLTEFSSTAGSESTASDWNSGTLNIEGIRVLDNGKVN